MTKKEIAVNAVHALKKEYPDAICSLVYTDPLQLLIATRLAAQCTDARVNMVTPSLFDRFKTAQDFADSTPEEVAEYIKSCGLYKTKSKDIVEMARMLCDDFGGVVPDNIDDLTKLPGIGRKTAQRVILDLKDKVKAEDILFAGEDLAENRNTDLSGMEEAGKEAVEALTALGYSASEAQTAVKKVTITENMTSEDVLKGALKYLAFL